MNEGARIRNIRRAAGLPQEKLARQVGVTQSMIAQIERGTKALTVPMAKEIATALGVDVIDLIGA